MATTTLSTNRNHAIPRPRRDRWGLASMGLLSLLGIGAVAGGAALVSSPDGSVMGFSPDLLAGSPFTDYFWPGLILGGLFGIGSFVVVGLGIRQVRLAPFLAVAIGVGQMIWIVVELAIIRELSFLHPICFGIGLLVAVTAVPWGWPTFEAWRDAWRHRGTTIPG
jgi:hypothetical protein